MGICSKQYEVATCNIHITPTTTVLGQFLMDDDFNVNYEIPGMKRVIDQLKHQGYPLADSFYGHMENDNIDGFDCLLGSDLIAHLKPMKTIDLNDGTAYQVQNGLILFGNVLNYLNKANSPLHYKENINNVGNCENGILDEKVERLVNSVINPSDSYFNPLGYTRTESDIDLQVENLFKIESLGIKEDGLSKTDDTILKKFDDSVELVGTKYHVEIPFKDSVADVPSNWRVALATLNKVHASLKTKNLLTEYSEIFQQQIERGIIEPVEIQRSDYDQYVFIPHHPVIKGETQTSTKVRVVYNASLKPNQDAPSLNQACFEGIDLLTNLVGLLLKFRQNKYILMSDIEKAFLQIYLKLEEDKNKFCFFWKENERLVIYRHKTLIFGLNCSPFVLNRVINHHLNRYEEDVTIAALKKSFYVDNFIFSTSSLHTLQEIYKNSLDVMAQGGFNLRSWMTNYGPLKEKMAIDSTIVQHDEPLEKLLGYLYDPEGDTIKLADFKVNKTPNPTKRQILSQISQVFDPLSLTLPVTIRGRMLMRKIWAEKTEWDEPVTPECLNLWVKLREDLEALKVINYPRMSVDAETGEKKHLNIFCDGSKSCYGFCCYVTTEFGTSQLIFSKGKLTPDGKSIPQTELLSVYLALKCLPLILESFPRNTFQEIYVWCDAQIVLEWLLVGGSKINNKFTKNRIKDAVQMKNDLESENQISISYKYVNTTENVADMITRGLKTKEFINNLSTWAHGPTWLNDQSKWPIHELRCLSESSKQKVNVQTNAIVNVPVDTVEPILELRRFSNMNKVHRITGKVFLFINKLKKRESEVRKDSEAYWTKVMQRESFPRELEFLQKLQDNETPDEKTIPTLVKDLNLYLDSNSILRCKGRISKLNFYSYNTLQPILLARTHQLTKMIVNNQHLRCKHLGVGSTLMQLRENGYWIPSGRQVVKDILKDCMVCKKLNCFSFDYPKLTNLPKERLHLVKPYFHTAIDYTSHLFVADDDGQLKKMYIVLYTCLGIRAVHLDVVPDLSLNSFLQSFKRFCNTYCIPSSIYTDNAKQFLASDNYVNQALVSDEFKDHLSIHCIKHKTIPAYASWVGGVYERQIKTMKQCLYKTVGRAKLNYFDLMTNLSDIQNAINSRPLTYVHSQLNEVEALTPNKILKLHTNPRMQLVNDDQDSDPLWNPESDQSSLHQQLNQTLKVQTKLFEDYKKMWYGLYILGLRETSKDVFQTNWDDRIGVNDIVLVNTQKKPKIYWLMGRVTKLIHGDDGKVRSAILRMPNQQTAHYSVKHLYPLEIQATHLGDRQEPSSTDRSSTDNISDSTALAGEPESSQPLPDSITSTGPGARPKRRAAQKCCQILKETFQDGSL